MTETRTETKAAQEIRTPGATHWDVDPTHSSVEFSVKHLMFATVRGRFRTFSASLVLDEANPKDSSVEATIDVETIDTGTKDRDDHLRSADFFDAAHHPKIAFRSTSVDQKGPDRAAVKGALTIRGVTRDVVLDVVRQGVIADPWGNTRSIFTATTSIDRRDYGLKWNAALETGGVLVGDKVAIELQVEAVRRVT